MGGGSCACTASARRKIISVAVKNYLNEIELSAGSDGQGDYPLQVREDECEQRLARTMREPIVSGSSDPKDGRRKRKDGKQVLSPLGQSKNPEIQYFQISQKFTRIFKEKCQVMIYLDF